jgi:hypothetical protein
MQVEEVIHLMAEGTTFLFSGLANVLLRLLYALAAPFRVPNREAQGYRFDIDLSFTLFRDKAWFTVLFVGVILTVAAVAILYAEFSGIPRYRVLLSIAATCTFWGLAAIYLQYFFARALGNTVARILAFVVASFLALIFGGWLIDQQWLDNLFGFLN